MNIFIRLLILLGYFAVFFFLGLLFSAIVNKAYAADGKASYYWQPQKVACGGRFNPNAMTAAHRTYPCGTRIRVTNKRNGKSVVVIVNDRGPFVKGRIVDLSLAAAKAIGMTGAGVIPVAVERIK